MRRVLATATADAYLATSDALLTVASGPTDLLANDTAHFHDIASITSSTDATDLYPVENLIQGAGVGYQDDLAHDQLSPGGTPGSRWVTAAPDGGTADFFNLQPPVVLTIDLGSDRPLDEISTWGYSSGNGNGVSEFNLAFATEAEGTGGFGTSITYNPSFSMGLDDVGRQSFLFDQTVTARYVQFTATDNYFHALAGGDRVGLGEIAFRIPDSASTPTTNLAAGKAYSYSRLPMFSGGTFYFDEPHVQTVNAFSPGDLTDGVTFPNQAPTLPNPSTIVGWGDPNNLDSIITFDLGATSRVTDVVIGAHTYAPFANGAPDNVQISFSTDGTNFANTETFTYTAADVPTNGHHDLPADVTDNIARFVRLSFDGGAVLTGGTPNKWMLDEISINGNLSKIEVSSADATSAQGATVIANADGSFSYDPTSTAAFDGLPEGTITNDTFSYTITDGVATDTATVTISVVSAGNPPTAIDDTLVTDEATPISMTGLTDPVALWRLDETSGTTAADSAGGNDATISGGISLGDPGATANTGTAFDYDSAPGRVEAPYSATLNPDGSFSVEAWVKVEGSVGNYRAVISARDGRVNTDRQGFIIYAANNNTWQFWTGAGAAAWDTLTGPAIELGQWTHLVATFEPSGPANAGGTYTGVKTLYVNGQQAAQATQRYEPNGELATRIGYGANESAGGDFFANGDLDNIAIYDQALSAEEVAARATDRAGVLGNDSDIDGNLISVTAVNGNTADVGNSVTLPSGATVTVEATGQVAYDPNGAFESVSAGSMATDTFTYTITEQPSLTDGVVAQYRLDGNALDSSGNGHDGTLTGTVTEAGQVADSLDFNGSGDKIDIPFSPAFNPDGDFTVSLWARVEGGAGSYRSPITSRDDPGGDTRGFIIYATPGNTWEFWTGQGAGGWATIGGTPVVENQWVHIAATFETTGGQNGSGAFNGIKTLYIDGVNVASATQNYEPNPQQLLRIGGGASEGPGQFFFNGNVDEVAVWDRTLSPTEIDNIRGLGLSGDAIADVAGATDTATVTVTINGLNDDPMATDDTIAATEDAITQSVAVYAEPFSTDAANAAAINASYPNIDAGTTDASISGGILSINTGDPAATVGITAATLPGVDRTISVDIGAETASPGSYNVGLTIGQNNIVFHPGLASPAGAFRVEGPGGFGNTSLGFVPAVNSLHSFVIEENGATGEFTITVTDGDNPANTFTTSFTNPGSIGGAVSLRRSGPNVGAAIFDNFSIGSSSLLANDVEIDSDDTLQASPPTVTSALGATVTINPDGTFSYDPTSALQSLAEGDMVVDTFDYMASDGMATDTATVTVNVTGVNDAPVAVDDNGGTTDQDTILAGSGLLGNDSDIDTGDIITVVAETVTSAGGATVTINTDGTFSYDPGTAFVPLGAGESTNDTFVYTIVDSLGATDTATVTVMVNGLDDPTVATDDEGRTDEDTPLTSVLAFSETFDTDAADATAINAAYPLLDATGFDASVTGGQLALNSGTINLPIILPGAGNDRTIVAHVGVNTGSPGSYNAGITIGDNNIVFHPGFTATPGAFRVEGPGGFGNTSLGFVPPIGPLHTFEIEENSATGEFTITVTDGANPNNVFTTSFTNPGSIGGEVSFRREGGNNGPALFDNVIIESDSLMHNDFDPDASATLSAEPASATSTAGAAVTINPDGTFVYDPGMLFQSLAAGETATDTFTYAITDGTVTDTATVTVTIDGVNDVPTNLMAGGTYTVAEGGTLNLSGSFSDLDTNDTHTIEWDINGDGNADAAGLTASFTWAQLEALVPAIDNGPATWNVVFSVDDGSGPVTDTATLTVTNTAPSVAIAAATTAPLAAAVDFTLMPSDPSTADTNAGFTYTIDWGDGTPVETVNSSGGAPSIVPHMFDAVGVRTVTVTIEDQDGDTSSATHDIEVVPVAIVGDDLVATGTQGSDRIIFFTSGTGVRVRYNNSFFPSDGSAFQLGASGSVVANGRDGNDQIIVSGRLPYPAVFDGGDGNDYLAGGTLNDTLRGNAGNDVILAGEGDNWLDGGDGSDRLEGRDGVDIIFGGAGTDRLNGGGGNDILDGGDDNDFLFGGLGDDLLAGRAGSDTIQASFGNDVLFGGSEADQLFAGGDNDMVIGGLGADRVRGDAGDDVLIGGTSGIEADLESSLDALFAGGMLSSNVEAALAAWFGSQSTASRALFEPVTDDNTADDLTGDSGVDAFAIGTDDRMRDLRSEDSTF